MKFKCDLCDKSVEFDQGEIVYDLLIEKKRFYCRACKHDYQEAEKLLHDQEYMQTGFAQVVLGLIKKWS